MRPDGFWRSCGIPVLVSLGVFSGLNALGSLESLRATPLTIVAFLTGSGVALFFLRRALLTGSLTRHDLGLGREGWTAPKRLLALALLFLLSYGQLALLRARWGTDPSNPPPTWDDYCFNFFVVLGASVAEMLAFLSIAFCWVERWLRERGVGRWPAAAAAGAFASVGFGLFHYTYPPFWHPFVLPLMGEMACAVLFFLATRNFWLTLLLHNATAAVGFTSMQDQLHTAEFHGAVPVAIMAVSFLLPFLYLHWLEWRAGPRAKAG